MKNNCLSSETSVKEGRPTIGLEIHTELATKTKIFCDCLNDFNEKHSNINICPICLGHPGVLPTINKKAVKSVLKVGLALNGKIAEFSRFVRKHYFYPDLPKGYQISQYQYPLVIGGYLEIPVIANKAESENFQFPISNFQTNPKSQNPNYKRIRIRRIHLEEDTGSLMHKAGADYSLIDYNRAGVPLMELVTEPDIASAYEAKKFAEELHLILRYLNVSETQMEKGQMRVEANISLQHNIPNKFPSSEAELLDCSAEAAVSAAKAGRRTDKIQTSKLGTKVEIKNLNSFRALEKAIEYEILRQSEILEKGEKVKQETRGWNENKEITFSQRSKEEAEDYRYFPEPDLPKMEVGSWKLEVGSELPELPRQKRERFEKEYGIKKETIEILVSDKNLADYFEKVVSEFTAWFETEKNAGAKIAPLENLTNLAVNYLTSDLLSLIKEKELSVAELLITPENFGELIKMLGENKISSRAAKDILLEMFRTGEDPSVLAEKMNLIQVSDEGALEEAAKKIVELNPEAALDFKKGKSNALQFLIGQMMKETKGKANPQVAAALLTKILE